MISSLYEVAAIGVHLLFRHDIEAHPLGPEGMVSRNPLSSYHNSPEKPLERMEGKQLVQFCAIHVETVDNHYRLNSYII